MTDKRTSMFSPDSSIVVDTSLLGAHIRDFSAKHRSTLSKDQLCMSVVLLYTYIELATLIAKEATYQMKKAEDKD